MRCLSIKRVNLPDSSEQGMTKYGFNRSEFSSIKLEKESLETNTTAFDSAFRP